MSTIQLAVKNASGFTRKYDFTPAYDASSDTFICECGCGMAWRKFAGRTILECSGCGHSLAENVINLVEVAKFRLSYLAGIMAGRWVEVDHAVALIEYAQAQARKAQAAARQGRAVNALIMATMLLAGLIVLAR